MINWHARQQITYRLYGVVTQLDIARMNSACLAFPKGKNYVIIRRLEKPVYQQHTSGDMLVAVVEHGEVTTAMLSWDKQPNRWADGSQREFTE